MNPETVLIELYLTIEAAYQGLTYGQPLRQRGPVPRLSDVELLTIEIVGERQGHHDDAAIWRYAKTHWSAWFPRLGSYPSFAKQSANLAGLKHCLWAYFFPATDDIHLTDGLPMPVCHLARAHRCRLFHGEVAYGYCAAKDEHYYGFKGHVIIHLSQQVVGFTLTAANIDEREVLDNFRWEIFGLLIGDNGLLSKTRQAALATNGLILQTPLRDNMSDHRPKSVVQRLLKTRRRIETAIGQLVEYYDFASCKARDLWHLSSKLLRKLIAYNLARA